MHKKYFDELKYLINLSFISIEELNNTIKHITNGNFSRNMGLAWHHINGLLIYTIRISRILWGGEKRGEDIRKILDIPNESIFHYQNRNIRNDFDHIDERIDDMEKGKLRFILNLDLNIGPIDTMIGNKRVGDYMRHYDQISKTIYFGEHNLYIPDLMEELKILETKVNNY